MNHPRRLTLVLAGLLIAPAALAVSGPLQQGVAALVFAVLLAALFAIVFSVLRHRREHTAAKHFHQSVGVELIWTLIPFLILFALAWPAAQLIFG
jgi:heme/copper-type cytochrome/quinol oxidase subunit 2